MQREYEKPRAIEGPRSLLALMAAATVEDAAEAVRDVADEDMAVVSKDRGQLGVRS